LKISEYKITRLHLSIERERERGMDTVVCLEERDGLCLGKLLDDDRETEKENKELKLGFGLE
jgi:hypothetical protein